MSREGERAVILKGARYGGTGLSKGMIVPPYLIGGIGTVSEMSSTETGPEFYLAEFHCWIPERWLHFIQRAEMHLSDPGWPKTHGMTGTRLYRIWRGMRARCETPSCTVYRYYGGRGITVCQEWMDFKTFYKWAISNGYADHLSIDRIDNDKGYSPDNCRWATQSEQLKNRRPFKRRESIIHQTPEKLNNKPQN